MLVLYDGQPKAIAKAIAKAKDLSIAAKKSFEREDFDDSISKWEKALKLTDKDDENIPTYQGNITLAKAAKIKFEGKKLMLQGDAKGAVDKFKQAIEILKPLKSKFIYDIQQCENNLADAYNKIGNEHFDKLNFDEAKKYYELAINTKSSDGLKVKLYKKNLSKTISAENNRDAETLNREGWEAFYRSDFKVAATKFFKASTNCDYNYENKNQFISNSKRAEANLLNKEGEDLFKQENFREALEKFRKANEKLTEAKKKTSEGFKDSFQHNLNKTQAAVYNLDGKALHENGDFVAAIKKFNEALDILPSTEIHRKVAIRNNLADTHNDNGLKLLKQQKNAESLKQFNMALSNASTDNRKREEISKNVNVAKFEIVYAESKRLLSTKNFNEALERLDLAMEIVPVTKEHLRAELIESKATALHGFGDELFKKSLFQEAKVKFEASRALTKNQSLKIQLTGKMEEAQLGFFENTYTIEMTNMPIYSDEVAARRLIKIVDLFSATMIAMGPNAPKGMADKLLTIMMELTKLRAFEQVFQAAEVGMKYFPERENDYKEVIDAQNKLRNDKNYLKTLGMKTIDKESIKIQFSAKFST